MSANKRGKKVSGTPEFIQIVPKFLQGRVQITKKPRGDDDSEDESPTIVVENKSIEPELDDRPDREDEAPAIVADDDIMALLSKQNVIHKDGKLELTGSAVSDPVKGIKAQTEDVVEFSSKKKKTSSTDAKNASGVDVVRSTIQNLSESNKKRKAEGDLESAPPAKKPATTKNKPMLSFNDEDLD